MKIILLISLLVISLQIQSYQAQTSGQQFVGTYTINSQCSSFNCPRDYLGTYSFVCPKSGQSMARISQAQSYSGYGVYQIEFETYNMMWGDSYFTMQFSDNNIITNPQSGQTQIQIPFQDGNILNIMPCYFGGNTSELCQSSNAGGQREYVVWKSSPNGVVENGCGFSMIQENNGYNTGSYGAYGGYGYGYGNGYGIEKSEEAKKEQKNEKIEKHEQHEQKAHKKKSLRHKNKN